MTFDQSQQQAPADYIYWVLFLRQDQVMPDDELNSLDSMGTLQLLQRLTKDWDPGFRCLFDPKSATAAPYQIVTSRPSALPLCGASGTSRVVLTGDAAHAMPPTAALGCVTALTDAHVLLNWLVENEPQKPQVIFRKFEMNMVEYAIVAMEKSFIGGEMAFGMKPFDELPTLAER